VLFSGFWQAAAGLWRNNVGVIVMVTYSGNVAAKMKPANEEGGGRNGWQWPAKEMAIHPIFLQSS